MFVFPINQEYFVNFEKTYKPHDTKKWIRINLNVFALYLKVKTLELGV